MVVLRLPKSPSPTVLLTIEREFPWDDSGLEALLFKNEGNAIAAQRLLGGTLHRTETAQEEERSYRIHTLKGEFYWYSRFPIPSS